MGHFIANTQIHEHTMKCIKAIVFVFTFLTISTSLESIAQYTSSKSKAIQYFEEGLREYRRKQYPLAIESFKAAIEKDETFVEPYMLLGDVYMDKRNYPEAASWIEKAIAINPEFFPGNYMRLAQAYYRTGEYEKALKNISKYMEYPPRIETSVERSEMLKEFIEVAIELKSKPVEFNPVNIGAGVNSNWEDYHPTLTVDGERLLFTRKTQRGMYAGRPLMQEDVYMSTWDKSSNSWGFAQNLGTPVNSSNYNEGAQSISPDGHYLFITICNRDDGMGSCDLYMSKKEGNAWTDPQNLGLPLNSSKWDAHPSLSSDGRTLYFSSARSGGKGKNDIWRSKLDSSGQWGTPEVLSFNTSGSEITPHIHADGKTLYFSSDGIPNLGGFDLFYVRMDDEGNFGEPVNLGYPINTHQDEHGLIVDAGGRFAFLASERDGHEKKLDIYTFELPEAVRPEGVNFAKGKVFDSEKKIALEANFELIDLSTGEIVVASSSDVRDGTFIMSLPSHKDYALNVSKEGYLFYSESFHLRDLSSDEHYYLSVPLEPIKSGKKVVLKNVFFETASYDLKKESEVELKKLARLLRANPSLKIEIGGHTDNVGDAAANQRLSQNRAKAVYDYLGKLHIDLTRLSYKGYGENQPIGSNDTEEGRAKNRRTEFKVL